MSNKAVILARLDAMGVPHETWHHEAAMTIEACMTLPYASDDITICKNILLCNRQQTQFYLYITLWDKPFRTADVSKLLGVSRLSFAPLDSLQNLQVESGSLAPFALWYDEGHRVRFVVDDAVKATPRIAFHPCDNTATVIFRQEDFWKSVVPELGAKVTVLTVPRPVEK